MGKYFKKIQKVSQILREPEIAEYFEGHPDDPQIFEEYYFEDLIKDPEIFIEFLNLFISEKFELSSNVLTIFKELH